MAEGDFADQMLKSIAVLGVRAGDAEIIIDRVNAIGCPAERDGSIAQRVLALRALGIFEHLTQRRLPDIEKSIPAQMFRSHLRGALG
jgi:hypothetical protein